MTQRLIVTFTATSGGARRQEALTRIAGLTDREREVLLVVGRGLSDINIGRELYMSEATVKTRVSYVLSKLGATNRAQIAILATTPAWPDHQARGLDPSSPQVMRDGRVGAGTPARGWRWRPLVGLSPPSG